MKITTQTKLKVLIVDDEALARRGLQLRLEPVPDIEIVGQAQNGREAIQAIQTLRPDLIFLDIQMPGLSGFDVIQHLDQRLLPAVVFVTAFDEYAIKAFESNAVDYLLKPIDDSRLHQALFKVRENLRLRKAAAHKRSLLKLVSEITGESVASMQEVGEKKLASLKSVRPKIAIRDGGKTTWVHQDEIEWVDAAGDYMCVHANGDTHIMRITMKELESQLDPDILQRVHRSTIVNINKVHQMQSHINGEYFLTLDSGHTVKLSRTYKEKLKYFQ